MNSQQQPVETARGAGYARQSILAILGSRGWSQQGLAEATNIDPSHLSKLLSGTRELTLDHICRMAHALGVKPGDLMENSAGAYADLLPILNQLRAWSADERYYLRETLESMVRMRNSLMQQAAELFRPSPTPPETREQGRKGPNPTGLAGKLTGEE